jgi:hypothetical protein
MATILIAEQCEQKSETVRMSVPFIKKWRDRAEGNAAENLIRDRIVQNRNDAAHGDISLRACRRSPRTA